MSQKESNNWFFGNNAAITFNGGAPVALSGSAMSQREGTATISDPQGNLMFYTDGRTVWDRTNTVMPSGSGLAGEYIATQSAVIVPMPQSATRYYIFTVDDWQNTSGSFNYSIVDMSLNGGKGDVVTKNVLINSKVREQVTSVYSGSNCSIWILTHELNNNNFDAYLLTNTGLNTTPVVSAVGMQYTGTNRHGYLKFAPSGKKVCSALGGADYPASDITIQLFDFDNLTGVVSNPVTVADNGKFPDAYGIEFSPDGSKLYSTATAINTAINQFDLSSGVSATIEASMVNIGSGSNPKTCLQMGPDKKIYVAMDNVSHLGVINNPNASGSASNYVDNAVNLGSGTGRLGFPNFIQTFFIYPSLGSATKSLCEGQQLPLDVTGVPGMTYVWQDGTPGPNYTITTAGTYWVKVDYDGCTRYDTTVVSYTPLPKINLGNDTTLCTGAKLKLDATNPAGTYSWQDGSTAPTYQVTTAGNYSVTVTNNSCSASDNIKVSYSAPPVISLGNDTALCNGQPLTLDGTNALAPTYLWQDGLTTPTYAVTTSGKYWLRETLNGCANSDTINVTFIPYPVVNLGNDTALCNGSTLKLDASKAVGTFLWQDASTLSSYLVKTAGNYSVTVNNKGCKTTDAINVTYKPLPVVNLGNDTALCNGQPLTLDGTNAGAPAYLWQDGLTTPTYAVTTSGKYWLRETLNGCVNSDTVNVTFIPYPVVNLGNDTALCNGSTLKLDASKAIGTFLWQDASTLSSYLVKTAGNYSVTVNNKGCKTTDAINVTYKPLPVVNLGNDTALCNGQPLTLDGTNAGAPAYLWQDGLTTPTYAVTTAGKYWLRETLNGCVNSDTVNVTFIPYPVVNLGNDTALCDGSTLKLDASKAVGTFLWQDASTLPTFLVQQAGNFSVTVNNKGCKTTDDINVTYNPLPVVDLGNDNQYCTGQHVLLDASASGAATYLWQDGSTSSMYDVVTGGDYWVKATTAAGCSKSDTVSVSYDTSVLSLGHMAMICLNSTLLLQADADVNAPATYRWQDGSTNADYLVKGAGTYSVKVTTACKSLTDTIVVGIKDCVCRIYLPDAFSPNNDGKNDLFRPAVISCNFKIYHLTIFTRWGNKVFESTDPAIGWDGTFKGQQSDLGAYVYMLQYQANSDTQPQVMRGTVTLIR